MGLLMPDTMPLDSTYGTTTWMHEGLTDWMYATEAARDLAEYEIEDSTE